MDYTRTLELVRLMWHSGKADVDAARLKTPFETPEYFRRLEGVVQSIRDHLKQHQLTGKHECLAKYADAAVTLLIDFDDLRLIPDPHDPQTPMFIIPSTRISKE